MTTNTTPLDDTAGVGDPRQVERFVSSEIVKLSPATTLIVAAKALAAQDVSFAVIGRGDDLEGVISERDIVHAVASGQDAKTTQVSDIESHSLKWAVTTSSVEDVAAEMLENYVRHILVCDPDGNLAGVVSMRDLLAAMLT